SALPPAPGELIWPVAAETTTPGRLANERTAFERGPSKHLRVPALPPNRVLLGHAPPRRCIRGPGLGSHLPVLHHPVVQVKRGSRPSLSVRARKNVQPLRNACADWGH